MESETTKEIVTPVETDLQSPGEEAKPTQKENQDVTESQEESDVEEASDEEIVLDEASDTENYVPPEKKEAEGDEEADFPDDVSCSSGEEEEGLTVQEVVLGEEKLYKLKFEDVEAKRIQLIKSLEKEAEEEETGEEEKSQEENEENKENEAQMASFTNYRTSTILDEDMEKDYMSDEDEDFDPVYCGETLSDVEYCEADERDTESEPETEQMEGSHRRTGETLVCIKMIEQLKIPPRDESCSSSKFEDVAPTDHPMECS